MTTFRIFILMILCFFTYFKILGQELHLNAGFGIDISRKFPEANFMVNNHNSNLTPKFKWSVDGNYRYPIWKKGGLYAVGGLGFNRTSFYFPIRADNDYASTLYENVNFSFYESTFSLGIHKTVDLYDGNVQLNFGLNCNWKVNLQNYLFKGSRGNDLSDMNTSVFFDTLYPGFRPYEYQISVEQPYRSSSSIDLQLNMFFRLNEKMKLTLGMRLPFLGQFDSYNLDVEMLLRRVSYFQPSDPNLPPVAGYWYYHKGFTEFKYYWFTTFNLGLIIDLKRK